MVAEHFAVVRGEDDIGVVALTSFFKAVDQVADLAVYYIDHGPVRRGDPAVIGVGHLVVGIHAFAAVGAAVIDALPDGFVVEFAFDVVGQRYVVDHIAVAFEVFARGIKGVMRVKGVEGEGPGHVFFSTSADEGDGALDAIGGLAVFFRGECLYVSRIREGLDIALQALVAQPLVVVIGGPSGGRVVRPEELVIAVVYAAFCAVTRAGVADRDVEFAG